MPNELHGEEFEEELVQSLPEPVVKLNLDKTKVLVLTRPGPHRPNMEKILREECALQTTFVAECDYDTVVKAIKTTRSSVFLHDWDAYSKIENHRIHQRLAKNDLVKELIRIIYSAMISSDLHALISDIHLVRIALTASLKLSILSEINSARFALQNMAPLQSELIGIRTRRLRYSEKKTDRIVAEGMKKHPHDPVVRLEYAFSCYRHDKLVDAEDITLQQLKQNTRNVRVLTLVALILMKKGKLEEAAQTLEQANFLSPQNSFRLFSLGEICNRKGDKQKARSYLQESVKADPRDDEAISNYAKFEIAEGHTVDAIKLFQKSLSDAMIAGMLNNTAVRYVREEKNDDALKLYQLALEALVTDRYKHAVYFNMALVYKRLKQYDKALFFLKKTLELKPDFDKAIREERLTMELTRVMRRR